MIEELQTPQLQTKKTSYLKAILISSLISALVFGGGVYIWQHNMVEESVVIETETPVISDEVEEVPQLKSPVDNIELRSNSRLSMFLHFERIPGYIYLESIDDLYSQGRLAYYYNWDEAEGQFKNAFVIREEPNMHCLENVMPISMNKEMRFVTEYKCGDDLQLSVTSFSYDSTQKTDSNIVSMSDMNEISLNEHFSYVYLKSIYNVIGWQDFDHLLIDQVTILDATRFDANKHELYLFNLETKEKQLIHTIN